MPEPVDLVLKCARDARSTGRLAEAAEAYLHAAALARAADDRHSLAHALRHLSDLARERGDGGEARAHAADAVSLYRQINDDRLGLANALRLQALSSTGEESRRCWQEARELYSSLDVSAGVAECDRHLPH